MKKSANTEKKLVEKQANIQEIAKNKIKTQVLKVMKLVITNKKTKKIRTFKDIFFDLINGFKSLNDITLTCNLILSTVPLSVKSKQANFVY